MGFSDRLYLLGRIGVPIDSDSDSDPDPDFASSPTFSNRIGEPPAEGAVAFSTWPWEWVGSMR